MSFRSLIAVFVACSSAIAQEASSKPEITPDTVVATVNGRKITAREYERILNSLNPQMRAAAAQQPAATLDWYALSENLALEAEKTGLTERSPYKERLADARRQVLMQAQMDEAYANVGVTAEEQKQAYEAKKERYREAKVKVIFLSRISQTHSLADGSLKGSRSAEETQAKADAVAKEARSGADFQELAKKHSDDDSNKNTGADYPEMIRPTSANIPQNVRDSILAASEGDIVGPIEHDTGFYIFRLEKNGFRPYDELKDEIYREMKDERLRKWLDAKRAESTVKIDNEAYFRSQPVPSQQ